MTSHSRSATPHRSETLCSIDEAPIPDNEDIFLELKHSSIHNSALRHITKLGDQGWFSDEMIDVAFELLEQDPRAQEQRIALAGTYYAKSCFAAARDKDVRETCYLVEKRKFRNRSFILFPINDAYDYQEYTNCSVGAHWSLLLIDLRGRLQGRYIDSLMDRAPGTTPSNWHIARGVFAGLELILRSDGYEAPIVPFGLHHVERNSPSQFGNNICHEDSGAACGPFTFRMAQQYVECIIMQRLGDGVAPVPWIQDIELRGVKFDSEEIRRTIQQMIIHEQAIRIARFGTAADYRLSNSWEVAAELQYEEEELQHEEELQYEEEELQYEEEELDALIPYL